MVYVDDIGSFPLSNRNFTKFYPEEQKAFARTRTLSDDFYHQVADSLKLKIDSGIDVVNYPQHYDMHMQFLGLIKEFEEEPYLIKEKYALMPELYVVKKEAKEFHSKTGEVLKLRVCVTGPVELYLKTQFGFYVYEDILQNLAKSVNRFIKNSILRTKHVETFAISIDEPSLGIVDLLNIKEEGIISTIEKSVPSFSGYVQMHLHSMKAVKIPLLCKGIDVIAGEFAASPRNFELIKKKDLDMHDKFIRSGITRTNIDYIRGEYIERGIVPREEQLVDEVKIIKKRFKKAKKLFGERMLFAGPDCGLGSWPSPEVAALLLKRTAEAVHQ